jgi:hypothetical protein
MGTDFAMHKEKFNLLKELYEQALAREEERSITFERKSSNLVGFLAATVGVFVGTLMPILLSEDFLCKVFSICITTMLWIASIIGLTGGVIFFMILVWRWRSMLEPAPYMYPDPSSLHSIENMELLEEEYINDLQKSVEFNQKRVNNLGTQFIKMVLYIKVIIVFFFISVFLLVLCKLLIR